MVAIKVNGLPGRRRKGDDLSKPRENRSESRKTVPLLKKAHAPRKREMSKIVSRTLDVFELFAQEKRSLSLTEMSKLLKIPVSSCHDVVRALAGKGYVYETAPRSGFYPTRRLHDMATTIIAHDSLLPRAIPMLEAAMESLKETVCLAKADHKSATYLSVFEPSAPLRFSATVGSRISSVFATSAGKALLGALPEDEFLTYMRSAKLARFTPHTILSKAKFIEEIEISRARGWYINKEESLIGVVTVSSHFLWNDSIYIVTVAGPVERMGKRLATIVAAISRICRALSESPEH
jgi:DNA-binding IclR family transcriptional regulator